MRAAVDILLLLFITLMFHDSITRYTHKTSGFKTSGFKTSGFKTSGFKTPGLQNARFTKHLVSKRPVFKFDILPKQKVLELSSLHS